MRSEYARAFSANGCEVRSVSSPLATAFWTLVTFGSMRPTVLAATKRGSVPAG